jgi:four helix bundle protein
VAENMKVYQKWEDMAKYVYIALQSYPKSERYTLAAETRRAVVLVGRYIYRANNVSKLEKRAMIEQADMALVDLKLLIRLGMVLGFMPIKKYEIASGQAVEIGRMLGGWLKATIT